MERGSRKHVLDWTESPNFLREFESLLAPLPVRFTPDTVYMPRGYTDPMEARLERFGPVVMPGLAVWEQLQDWWLAHRRGANTPNWDIAATCEIEGKAGLVLVEAKANWPELGAAGKRLDKASSPKGIENHERIGAAIDEACKAWQRINPHVNISRDSHYQLANRLAFTWKLGSLGIPVILVYLGFTGDEGIRDAGAPFTDDANWRKAINEYAADVVPMELFEVRHDLGAAPVWLALRSRGILESSPPRTKK